jgi:hypothetical protein
MISLMAMGPQSSNTDISTTWPIWKLGTTLAFLGNSAIGVSGCPRGFVALDNSTARISDEERRRGKRERRPAR